MGFPTQRNIAFELQNVKKNCKNRPFLEKAKTFGVNSWNKFDNYIRGVFSQKKQLFRLNSILVMRSDPELSPRI